MESLDAPSVMREKNNHGVSVMDIVRLILAIVLPPVGVFLTVGIGLHFWLNIILTLCGYIPGIIHALYVILKKSG